LKNLKELEVLDSKKEEEEGASVEVAAAVMEEGEED